VNVDSLLQLYYMRALYFAMFMVDNDLLDFLPNTLHVDIKGIVEAFVYDQTPVEEDLLHSIRCRCCLL